MSSDKILRRTIFPIRRLKKIAHDRYMPFTRRNISIEDFGLLKSSTQYYLAQYSLRNTLTGEQLEAVVYYIHKHGRASYGFSEQVNKALEEE